MPTTVERAGTSWITTEFAPTFDATAHVDRAEQLRARSDDDVVLDRRVALAAREAGAAERHALVERHVVADLGRLADHDAGAVIDEERVADPRRRVDLDARQDAARVGHRVRHDRHAGLVERVRDPVGEQRLDAAVGEEDLEPADAARGRVAFLRGRQVLPQLAGDPRECAQAEHQGAKNGVET